MQDCRSAGGKGFSGETYRRKAFGLVGSSQVGAEAVGSIGIGFERKKHTSGPGSQGMACFGIVKPLF